jgi:hypothetical protein
MSGHWQDAEKAALLTRPAPARRDAAFPMQRSRFLEILIVAADFFSILLGEVVLRHTVSQCIAGDLEEPACFGNIAACALQRFL